MLSQRSAVQLFSSIKNDKKQPKLEQAHPDESDMYDHSKVSAFQGHSFPDFVEKWNRQAFRRFGYGLTGATVGSAVLPLALGCLPFVDFMAFSPSVVLGLITASYWKVGLADIKQSNHAIRRNYPVLGNIRYIFETVRPEIRQYFVESDLEGRPIDRMHRSQVYQRAKNVDDTMAFGTHRKVYDVRHEWACHSMYPVHVDVEKASRLNIGTPEYSTKPYSSSILNISAMSYGALGDHAIRALNNGAKLGNFYHNTGEGGVSRFHKEGGDIVWNIGTGYFGCGAFGSDGIQRVFDPALFKETIDGAAGKIKMIEIKLSQGAKPGHGGLLPKNKITPEIAEARKLSWPPTQDCHSPSRHTAFNNPVELVEFIAHVRELAGGMPVGVKMCVGHPGDFAAFARAIVDVGNGPDFITVDGAEGGTGAAPPEFMNSVGLPLEEGLVLVRNVLEGAGIRDKTTIIVSGQIFSGFAMIRNIALGADAINSARGFLLSLGCIQALKCNTNKCPTGITTNDKELQQGLDPLMKQVRVYNYHKRTVAAACDILASMGHTNFSDLTGDDIMRRVKDGEVRTFSEQFPEVEPGSLLVGKAPKRLQTIWDACSLDTPTAQLHNRKRWIY